MRIERRKWPDTPHYGWPATMLGEDEHGAWLGCPGGRRVSMPDGTETIGERAAVWCVPWDDWFLVGFWLEHPEVSIYVDVCTPAAWSDGGARMIDLDFDVIVWRPAKGGHVELVDEDEFELHRVALAYPDDVIAGARTAAADLLQRVRAGEPPFTAAAAAQWVDRLPSRS